MKTASLCRFTSSRKSLLYERDKLYVFVGNIYFSCEFFTQFSCVLYVNFLKGRGYEDGLKKAKVAHNVFLVAASFMT
jgi:hypothetical protein